MRVDLRAASPLTCPRCGAALGGSPARCPSCLAELVDPWSRFETRVRGLIIALCVGGALWLAGATVIDWLHARR